MRRADKLTEARLVSSEKHKLLRVSLPGSRLSKAMTSMNIITQSHPRSAARLSLPFSSRSLKAFSLACAKKKIRSK